MNTDDPTATNPPTHLDIEAAEADLYTDVTREPMCSICTVAFGTPIGPDGIAKLRARLNLKDGEFLEYNHGKAAAEILGR